MKAQRNQGMQPNLFFFRDSSGLEVDLIMEEGLVPHPIEIKSAQTYSPALYANLQKFAALEPAAAEPTLVYGGEKMGTLQGVRVLSFAQTARIVGAE